MSIEPQLTEREVALHRLVHIDYLEEAGVDILFEIRKNRLDADVGVPVRKVDQVDFFSGAGSQVHDGTGIVFLFCYKVTLSGQIQQFLCARVEI